MSEKKVWLFAGFFEELSPEQVRNQIETLRFAAGADAEQTFEAKANTLLAQAQAHRELSASLAHDDA